MLRKILEGKQIQSETIADFLERKKSALRRYSSSFRLLWRTLSSRGLHPPKATVDQVAEGIIKIFATSPSQARNAYSAVLLLPEVGGALRFNPLLNPYKRIWNTNVERYGAFWDPLPVLRALQATSMDCLRRDVKLLRTQLIICCRLLCLYRSSDLSSLRRCISVLQSCPFIQIKRKGQKIYKWERVVSLPQCPQISPFHLIKEYVALTHHLGRPGGPVLLSLSPPYGPLTADTVGSITKIFLQDMGISPQVWGPHSTRGAGVGLMKRLGLSSDEVCEIGKWKGVEAFTAHYQRLGAQQVLEEKLTEALAGDGVHSLTSHRGSAEPEVSRTPPRATDRGGRDTEGEAQDLCEPTQTHPKESAKGGAPRRFQFSRPKRGRSPDSQGSAQERPNRLRQRRGPTNSGKTAALEGGS